MLVWHLGKNICVQLQTKKLAGRPVELAVCSRQMPELLSLIANQWPNPLRPLSGSLSGVKSTGDVSDLRLVFTVKASHSMDIDSFRRLS